MILHKRECILIAPCMLAAGFQAEANHNTTNWRYPFIEVAINNNVDIHVLPCTESLFNGLEIGLSRRKHGIDYYSNLSGYHDFCAIKASETAEMIDAMAEYYKIIAIIGVEHSPSCAVNYMYSHRGMLKKSGLFMHSLKEHLLKKNISIPFIGVNRKYPRKSLMEFENLLAEAVNERERIII